MKRISMTYGQVLFELGIKKESLQKAQDMLHENEELLSALENPTITKKEKENVVEKLFSDDIKSFLKVVCDNDDIACFDEAVEYYDELKRKTDKIIKAEFDYVTMPKDEQLERIKQYLMKQYQADKVELTLKEEVGGVWVCVKIFPCGFFYLYIIFFCSVTSLSPCFVYSPIIFFLAQPVKFFYFRRVVCFRACRVFVCVIV